jgi:transposase
MQFFVGLDVSLGTTSVCVIDERGVIIKEGKAESLPQSIARFVRHQGRKIEHVGLEAGQLSEWLHAGLSNEGFRVTVMESRHVRAAFAAMTVKTDRNDARGIAQLVRLGWFKSVHVKALNCQQMRAVLNARQFLVDKITGIENCMRASLRNFGLKLGQVSRRTFASRARELAEGHQCLELIIDSLLRV